MTRLLKRSRGPKIKTADVFTTAIPTVNYVARRQIDADITQELERRDKIICVTGPSKSGKTVVIKKLLPNAPVIIGQVGIQQREIWRHLCAIHNIPLHVTEATAGSMNAGAGPVHARVEKKQGNEAYVDARKAFLDFVRNQRSFVFDDFHYFEREAQQELLQGLRPLLLERVTIVIILTSYGEDQPILAERDILARIRFIKVPDWSDEDLEEILRKGLNALNLSVPTGDIRNIVRRAYGSPLIVQELGAFLCYSSDVRERTDTIREIGVGDIDVFVRRAVQHGALAADKPTFMRLIIGRTPPRERKEYRVSSQAVGDVYFLIFNALRALDLSAAVPADAINKWIRENVIGPERPQGGQITTALEGLRKTSRELVEDAQKQNRTREFPIEWRPDIKTLYVNDPFLKLYIKYANWDDEYRERLGQLKSAGRLL